MKINEEYKPYVFHSTLSNYQGDVLCCAFSGRLLAIGSADKLVRLFALDQTGMSFEELPQSPLVAHSYAVNFVTFTPLGTLLATCSQDGKVIVWDVRTGKKTGSIEHESHASLRMCQFSPDARLMVTGSDDETLALWDVGSRKHVRSMEGHEASVVAVCFTPDGSYLCSGSTLGDLRFWDARYGNGRNVALYKEAHDLGVTSAQFSPSFGAQGAQPEFGNFGSYLLATGGTDNLVKLWRVSVRVNGDHELRVTEYTVLNGHTQNVMCVAFTPSGSLLASSSGDKTVIIWDPIGGTKLSTLSHHHRYVTSVAFSSDGSLLAAGSNDKTVSIWKVQDVADIKDEDDGKLPPEQEFVRRRSTIVFGTSEVKKVTDWSHDEVGFWLTGLHLPQYKDVFRDNLIDGQELVHLNDTMLKSLKIEAMGHRNRILRAVKSLRDRYNISSHPKNGNTTEKDSSPLPHEYYCPITHEVMTDPVIAADGYTYERSAISSWVEGGKRSSPMTNAPLPHLDLTPNRMLKMLIQKNVKI